MFSVKKITVVLALGMFACLSANAQSFFDKAREEVTVKVGTVMSTSSPKVMENAALYGVDYSRFNDFGLGFKTGLQLTQNMYQMHDLVEVPLAVIYKTRSIGGETRLRNAAYGAAFSAWYDRSFSSMLGSFLMGLFSDVDVYAGMTPGLYGGAFSTTLDAGADINFTLWRLSFKLMPAFHYNITNNYQYLIEYDGFSEPHSLRSLFSICVGLSYSF